MQRRLIEEAANVVIGHADELTALDQAIEKSLPRFVRLAPAHLQRNELLLSVGEHRQGDQHRDAHHPLVHPHSQRDRVEVEKRYLEVRQGSMHNRFDDLRTANAAIP